MATASSLLQSHNILATVSAAGHQNSRTPSQTPLVFYSTLRLALSCPSYHSGLTVRICRHRPDERAGVCHRPSSIAYHRALLSATAIIPPFSLSPSHPFQKNSSGIGFLSQYTHTWNVRSSRLMETCAKGSSTLQKYGVSCICTSISHQRTASLEPQPQL